MNAKDTLELAPVETTTEELPKLIALAVDDLDLIGGGNSAGISY